MMPGGVGIRNHADTQPGFGEAQLYILLSTNLLHREQRGLQCDHLDHDSNHHGMGGVLFLWAHLRLWDTLLSLVDVHPISEHLL